VLFNNAEYQQTTAVCV